MNHSQPAESAGVSGVLAENIEALLEDRRRFEGRKTWHERVADRFTGVSGSILFVYVHVALVAVWLALNLGAFGTEPFDPPPFDTLSFIVGIEAVLLSTFVLISQNRAEELSDRRADLDIQVNLLSERELTIILDVLQQVARRLDIDTNVDEEVDELTERVSPSVMLDALEQRAGEEGERKPGGIPG
jgi:uncharacterized membrane protein